MKLSHTTKVAVRKALAALRIRDDETQYMGPTQELVFGKTEQQIANKAGFSDRDQLVAFAIKYRLMQKPYDNSLPPQRQRSRNMKLELSEKEVKVILSALNCALSEGQIDDDEGKSVATKLSKTLDKDYNKRGQNETI